MRGRVTRDELDSGDEEIDRDGFGIGVVSFTTFDHSKNVKSETLGRVGLGWSSGEEVRGMASRAVSSLQSLNSWDSISYLSQREAAEIDDILMGPLGFSVVQLMELAGLSVATAIAEVYRSTEYNRVLAICGPGNSGGDGLVAACHLHHFGYKLSVCYPKRTPKPLYDDLLARLESLCVHFLSVEDLSMDLSNDFDILVDAMFGFSFRAPKLCAKRFCGPHHFLGGRFVPPSIVDKHKLQLPSYPGTSMCVRIGKPPQIDVSALRENYISPDSSCMVLLKGVDKGGFVWYTNYESRKAHEISENPHALLLFYWDGLHCQARVEGFVEKVSDEESEQYFHSRP
ncbi:hypothetical protein LOK49_LG05G03066 [Camellia lanceoleosa]|uniref:Uncharacterized protein n=1 Tax=Camellia lanceoleosa TaxID=1840588 RepID=A0ACC0HSS6_9ERIC|nr:hypothetical protein LOK49_LG05G03066 [Camellia lanceoleosa]